VVYSLSEMTDIACIVEPELGLHSVSTEAGARFFIGLSSLLDSTALIINAEKHPVGKKAYKRLCQRSNILGEVPPIMQLHIREGKKSDLETFWKATLNTSWNDIPNDERSKMERKTFESHFRQVAAPYLEDPRNELYIAEDESGKFVGYTLLGKTTAFYSSKQYGFIYDIYVTEWARQIGVGKQLLEFAIKWCFNKGLDKIKLEVAETNNSAKSLYEKLGFKTERRIMGKPLK